MYTIAKVCPRVRRQWLFVLAPLLIFVGQGAGQAMARKPAVGQSRAVVNFSDLARQQVLLPRREPAELSEIPEGKRPAPFPVPPELAAAVAAKTKSAPRFAPQAPAAQALSPAPAANFAGLGGGNVDGFIRIPPDTDGAVGPHHLVVALNNGVLVQTRTGSTAKAAVGLSAFWGVSPSGTTHAFDPHVLYNASLDRWIMVSVAAGQTTSSALLVAMSQTNDPTGNWTQYSFPADQTAANGHPPTTPTLWGDYPLVGFNKTWVVVTINMFTIAGGAFNKGTIFAIDINGLANGVAAANLHTAVFHDPNAFALCPAFTFDPNLSTLYMLETFNGNSNGTGVLRINSMTGAVGSEAYNIGQFVITPNPWAQDGGGSDFAPQNGANKIDAGDDRTINVVYRNGSLWASHSVFLPVTTPTRSAVQWWQISPTCVSPCSPQQIGRIDDSSGVNFYAYPSIAVNKNDDILLGFAHFSAGIFAEAMYAFAPFAAGANTVQSPLTFKTGEAYYYVVFGSSNRWGDYSATLVDPVNDLDFWTLQEYASSTNLCQTPTPTCTGGWATWWAKLVMSPTRKRLVQVTSD